jgi:ssDNA-binding Zn-finger/Zn-ribbon topoisomerase 1
MNEITEEMIHREEGKDLFSEPPEQHETLIGGVQCPKCDKMFKNDIALRMHDIRKHQNRGWSTTQNFGNSQSKEEKLAKKRAYNRKWRLARGMKVRPASLKGGNKGMKLPKWSPSRLAKFRRTMRQKSETRDQVVVEKPTVANPGVVTFCPRCGCNIKVVAAAIAFGDNQ